MTLTLFIFFQLVFLVSTTITLRRSTDYICAVHMPDYSFSIEKTYIENTITCDVSQLKYTANGSMFDLNIIKHHFSQNFRIYYKNSDMPVIFFENNTVYKNGEIHGYFVEGEGVYYYNNKSMVPLFFITSWGRNEEYTIMMLNNYSDFDLSLVIARYSTVLLDRGHYPTKDCATIYAIRHFAFSVAYAIAACIFASLLTNTYLFR